MGDLRFQQHGPSDKKESQSKTRKRNTRKDKSQSAAESGVDLVKERLGKVNASNGFIGVCDIVESDSLDGLRPRSIAIEPIGNGIALRIKAQGKTLQTLQQAMQEMFSDEFEVERLAQSINLTRRQ